MFQGILSRLDDLHKHFSELLKFDLIGDDIVESPVLRLQLPDWAAPRILKQVLDELD